MSANIQQLYLGRRHHRERVHDPVWVLFSDLADEQGAHTGTGAAPKWMCELEALQTVAALRFPSNNVKDCIDELSALGVVALGPVVSGTALAKHKIVRTEDLAERSWSDWVHGTRLQVQQHSTGDILATCIEETLDDVKTTKCFPHYCPFVRGIHQWLV